LGAQINHDLGHTNLESHGRGDGEAHILDDAFVTSNLAQGGLADPSAAQGAPPPGTAAAPQVDGGAGISSMAYDGARGRGMERPATAREEADQ
jgi:hypothetical protein